MDNDNELVQTVTPSSLIFSMFTKDDILKLSVKKITTSLTFDNLGYPLSEGLYDLALGPLNEKSDPCKTCLKNIYNCPGHFGHIELPVEVINPLFYKSIQMIIKMSCSSCHMVQIPLNIKQILKLQMQLLDAGFVIQAQELANYMNILVEDLENVKETEHVDENSSEKLLKKYIKLARSGSVVYNKNKNIESIRNKFISTLLKSIQLKAKKKCIYCKNKLKKVTTSYNKFVVHEDGSEPRMIMPDEIKTLLHHIWESNHDVLTSLIPLLKTVHLQTPTDVMFIKLFPILPPVVRPINYVDDMASEHPQTVLYKLIIETSLIIRNLIQLVRNETQIENTPEQFQVIYQQQQGSTALEKFHFAWEQLQAHVDHIMNNEIPKNNSTKCDGLKQIIEKKKGIIRQHMMGKRVNFAARSVITPDPNLNINEIGIPEAFAKQLTYPVPVTTWNVGQLQKLILNGPNEYPGAVMVESENGSIVRISDDPNIRKSIAKRLLVTDQRKKRFNGLKIVHRHLLTGDILLLNRQPTLHKPSIMGHVARILKGEKTLRLHYANCKAYNADFDGDEMNAHYPQNEIARSEAYNIVSVSNQYLVPKDGTPLSGLIQDHVISGVKLSIRGKFFTKDDYCQLVYIALNHKLGHITLVPPAIRKPCYLWSGKQIISTIIINSIPKGSKIINLSSVAKISSGAWQREKPRRWKAGGTPLNGNEMSENQVIIRSGELLVGVLDKMHYGATPYGLVHCIFELYGGEYSNILLSALAKLFTSFLQREGFTLGVHDILVVPEADRVRKELVNESRKIGKKVAAQALGLNDAIHEREIKTKMEEAFANNPKFRTILDRQYKSALDIYNNNINKACVPAGLVAQFPDNNLQLMIQSGAKGSMVNSMQISCLLGQIELEGKRPPIMISGRTLPSFPPYETEPRAGGFIDGRFMTGIQPQEFFFHCMAGREGLIDTAVKTSRSGYLQRCLVKHLEGLSVAYDLTVRDADNSVVQFFYGEDGMDVCKSQFLKKDQLNFLEENKNIILTPEKKHILSEPELDEITHHRKALKSWKKHSTVGEKKSSTCPDPLVSKFQPDHYPGVINEHLDELIADYLKNRHAEKRVKKDFTDMMKIKAMETMCPPGEPVGLLAAQSIGEPSTQMTLNTFHFAGRGEMNVTLGIPRLREILMCASKNIKTPNMEIPIYPHVSGSAVQELVKRLTLVTLANVLEKIHIKKHLDVVQRTQVYRVRFHFLPPEAYSKDYCVKPKRIFKHMEKVFFVNMFQAFKKAANVKIKLASVKEEKTEVRVNEPLEDEGDEGGDESDKENEESHYKRNKFEDSDSDVEDVEDEVEEPQSPSLPEENDEKLSEEDSVYCSNVVNSLYFASNYTYDAKQKRWCEITFGLPFMFKNIDIAAILKETAYKSVIWQTPNIRRAITYIQDGQTFLRTDGININEIFKYMNMVNVRKLYTNDIHGMAATYGIEAAVRVIKKEIKDVFNVYGITVDSRHLSLIADYMTFNGTFQPMSRTGMEDSASPLQQMSFEASLVFLRNAVIQGKTDMLKTPSSCLMIGYPCRSGTGAFDLVGGVNTKCFK